MKKIVAEPYRDIDFTNAKQGAVIPLDAGKTKIVAFIPPRSMMGEADPFHI